MLSRFGNGSEYAVSIASGKIVGGTLQHIFDF